MSDVFHSQIYMALGHSFIRKLQNYTRTAPRINLGLTRSEVILVGRLEEVNISYAYQVEKYIDRHAMEMSLIDVLGIDVACNDLLSRVLFLEPIILAIYVYRIARKARYYGVKRVFILEALFHYGRAAVPHWRQHVRDPGEIARAQRDYNMAITAYNRHLQYLCRNGDGTVVVRRQRGLHIHWLGCLAEDGCHMNANGMVRYYRNMRSTFIKEGFKAMTARF